MSDFINTMDVIGDEELTKRIIERSVTEYKDNIVTKIGENAFYGCKSLTTVESPSTLEVGDAAFYGCTELVMVDLANAIRFSSVATLYNDQKFKALILRSETMVELMTGQYNTNNLFQNLNKARAYVPSSLVDSYKSDANWSKWASCVLVLEDITVDGTITGAIDLTKLAT